LRLEEMSIINILFEKKKSYFLNKEKKRKSLVTWIR